VRNNKRAEEIIKETWRSFGQWIAEQRLKKGWSQTQLGEMVGMKYQQIGRIENGNGTKRITVIRLADALGIEHRIALDKAGFKAVETPQPAETPRANSDIDRLFFKIKQLPPKRLEKYQPILDLLRRDLERDE
jgi:transcriptional regulator with XRE-family HTH domain